MAASYFSTPFLLVFLHRHRVKWPRRTTLSARVSPPSRKRIFASIRSPLPFSLPASPVPRASSSSVLSSSASRSPSLRSPNMPPTNLPLDSSRSLHRASLFSSLDSNSPHPHFTGNGLSIFVPYQ